MNIFLFASLFIFLYTTARKFIAYDDGVILETQLRSQKGHDFLDSTNCRASFIDTVVVAGAWRAPDETLSKAFKVRIEYGIRIALLYGSNTLFLTGGRNDAHVALDYVRDMSTKDIFGSFEDGSGGNQRAKDFVSNVPSRLEQRVRVLRSHMISHQDLGSFLSNSNNDDTGLKIALENRSGTTFENAREFANSTDPYASQRTIVVSSRYHMQRCRILFCNALPGHEVYVLGVPDSEFEFLLPPVDGKWIIKKKELPARWKRKKIAQFVPMSAKLFAHSTKETISHWRSHIRATYVSVCEYSTIRELGAYVVNIHRGHLRLIDVVRSFVRYITANFLFVMGDIFLVVITISSAYFSGLLPLAAEST